MIVERAGVHMLAAVKCCWKLYEFCCSHAMFGMTLLFKYPWVSPPAKYSGIGRNNSSTTTRIMFGAVKTGGTDDANSGLRTGLA